MATALMAGQRGALEGDKTTILRTAVSLLPYFILLFSLGFGWHYVSSPNVLPVKSVKIEGRFQYINKSTMQHAILPYVLDGFLSVNVSALHQKLIKQPWIAAVEIKRVWPDTLRVKVREKQPLAIWNDGSIITTTGQQIALPPHLQSVAVPHWVAPRSQQTAVFTMYKKMSNIVTQKGVHIEKLVLTERHSWQITLDNGVQIRLGRTQVLQRLARFIDLYPNLIKNNHKRLISADLRYTRGMAIKWQ